MNTNNTGLKKTNKQKRQQGVLDQRRDCSEATKFAYLIDKNKGFARPSLAFFFLIPCISFKFSANLRREMTISQGLRIQRT